MDKVIILMSTYNGEKYLREQLESIFAQKGVETELIVRDDGSTDSTPSILSEYEEQGRLSWYTGKNLRSAGSFMDLLFKAPDAPFYAFADQDDIWDDDKMLAAVRALKRSRKPAIYHSNARLANSEGIPSGNLLHGKSPRLNFYSLSCAGGILGCTMAFNKAVRDELLKGGKPEKIRMHDYYLGMIALGMGGDQFYDHKPHINYRQHSGNVLGVAYGVKDKLRSKLKQFGKREEYTIADQAGEILERYGDRFTAQNRELCAKVASYDKNLLHTVGLAFSPKTHYSSLKNSAFLRACILFRRR